MAWSLVDIWFPGETDRAAELDRKNAELNRRREAMGRQTADQTSQQEARFNSDIQQWNQQVYEGFAQGAAEGAAATAGRVKGILAAPVDWLASAIPWQIWALAAVGVFVWIGGPTWLRGILAKK